jgi:hypothetical protein
MKKPNLLWVVIRTLYDRPLFPQMVKVLERRVHEWEDAACDCVVAVHGKGKIDDLILSQSVFAVWDYRGATAGHINSIILRVLQDAYSEGYDFVAVMDEDADLGAPIESVDTMLEHYKSQDRLAALGPLDSYRIFTAFKHKVERGDMFALESRPWATSGCQTYRMAAVMELPLKKLFAPKEFTCHSDVLLWTLLHCNDWVVGEVALPFDHVNSNEFRNRVRTAKEYDKRVREIEQSYAHVVRCIPDATIQDEVAKMCQSETKQYKQRKISKKKISAGWSNELGLPQESGWATRG